MTDTAVPPETFHEAEHAQFGFWCGHWLASSRDDRGRVTTGTNHVDWLWDRTVLRERFVMAQEDGTLFRGTSLSVPVVGRGWCQTWVDDSGAYLDFVGGWTGTAMVLSRTGRRGGRSVRQRMTWRDITDGAFGWDWESSTDGGTTWRLDWHLDYRRR